MELSVVVQEHVIVPLGSLGVTVLVRCPVVLHYPGIQDLSNQVSNFPRSADLIVFIRVYWSDVHFKHHQVSNFQYRIALNFHGSLILRIQPF